MKRLFREIRLSVFVWMIGIAFKVLPKDAIATIEWLKEMPFEE